SVLRTLRTALYARRAAAACDLQCDSRADSRHASGSLPTARLRHLVGRGRDTSAATWRAIAFRFLSRHAQCFARGNRRPAKLFGMETSAARACDGRETGRSAPESAWIYALNDRPGVDRLASGSAFANARHDRATAVARHASDVGFFGSV